MGCCVSKGDEHKESQQQSDEIERQIRLEQRRLRNEVKLLLLGAGESGKSTLFRQVRLIHSGKFTAQELDGYREVIIRNCIDSIRAILDAMVKLDIDLELESSKVHAAVVRDLPASVGDDGFPPSVADAVEALWQDPGVLACYRRSREYQLHDSAMYFFEAVRRISAPDFVPTVEDVLRCRVKTTGISEISYKMDDRTYKLVDVGGQRSERKKWIHCFEGVTALIFMVAVNEYDMTLIEDSQVNRMREALYLFDSICNNKYFANTAVILIMNKIDLLKDKILASPLENYFPDYTGGPSYDRALDFITNMFVSLHKSATREIYSHRTCATETPQVTLLMEDVNRIITNRNLRLTGFL